MAGENPRTRTGERGDAVSNTPRTDAAAFGTDDESLSRLFGIRELPRYVVPVDFARQLERELAAVTAERDVLRGDLCTFAVDMERELSAVTAERDSMVARFQDEINQRQETQRANAILDAQILAAVTAERDALKADRETELFQMAGYLSAELTALHSVEAGEIMRAVDAWIKREAKDAKLAKEGK